MCGVTVRATLGLVAGGFAGCIGVRPVIGMCGVFVRGTCTAGASCGGTLIVGARPTSVTGTPCAGVSGAIGVDCTVRPEPWLTAGFIGAAAGAGAAVSPGSSSAPIDRSFVTI